MFENPPVVLFLDFSRFKRNIIFKCFPSAPHAKASHPTIVFSDPMGSFMLSSRDKVLTRKGFQNFIFIEEGYHYIQAILDI